MMSYNTTSVCEIPVEFLPIVNPVGQLVEVGDKGEVKWRFCTGFNILNARYFLTAGHCTASSPNQPTCSFDDPYSPISQGRCVVNFDYNACQYGYKDTRQDALKFVSDGSYSKIQRIEAQGFCTPSKIDYGVLTLMPDAGSHGSLELANYVLREQYPLIIVQHPEGYPKQLSEGVINGFGEGIFSHTAHTKGGSSGSPVISANGSQYPGVIGVHVAGDGVYQTSHIAVNVRNIVENAAQQNHSWVKNYLPKFGLFKSQGQAINIVGNNQVQRNQPGGCCN